MRFTWRRFTDSTAFQMYFPNLRVALFVLVLAGVYVLVPSGGDLVQRLAQAVWVIGLGIVVVVFPRAWPLGAVVPLALMFVTPPLSGAAVLTATVILILGPPVLCRLEAGVRRVLRRDAVDDVEPSPAADHSLAGSVAEALRRAAERVDGRPVPTGALLVALSEIDRTGDWAHFWTVCGYPQIDQLKVVADPISTSTRLPGRAHGVDFTLEVDRALYLASAIGEEYRLVLQSGFHFGLPPVSERSCPRGRCAAT